MSYPDLVLEGSTIDSLRELRTETNQIIQIEMIDAYKKELESGSTC
jgi:hypothetical protein